MQNPFNRQLRGISEEAAFLHRYLFSLVLQALALMATDDWSRQRWRRLEGAQAQSLPACLPLLTVPLPGSSVRPRGRQLKALIGQRCINVAPETEEASELRDSLSSSFLSAGTAARPSKGRRECPLRRTHFAQTRVQFSWQKTGGGRAGRRMDRRTDMKPKERRDVS